MMDGNQIDSRALVKAALSPDWNQADSITLVTPQTVGAAIAAQESSMIPLKDRFTPATLKESDEGRALDIALRPIGAKLAPKVSAAVAAAWRDAVMMSLMKWPARVALAAAKAGVMERYQYGIDDVDARLHELAEAIDTLQRRALSRLQRMRAEIERAMNPPAPMIEEKPHIWTADDIELCNRMFIKVGSATRYRLGESGTCEGYEIEPDERGVSRRLSGEPTELDAR